ncbi:MAG: hypothetical protein J6K22_02480 [Spirochaetaceae bacterium]|nr:hypothetical protein [Treponema sp.]MBP3449311.1 hypothetical protein [Spirochaetaceae bacterium]
MKKFLISMFILIIFAGAIFFIGWGQFAVPAGSYGVMVSKTSGISQKTIVPGEFCWFWERLLPTNTSMRIFSIIPVTRTTTISGELPSADIYSPMLEGSPNFSYKFSVQTELMMKSNYLPNFVRRTDAKENEQLQEYLNQQGDLIAQEVIQYILSKSLDNANNLMLLATDTEELKAGINADSKFKDLEISNITVKTAQMPDTELYNIAKASYAEFQAKVKQSLAELTKNQSTITANDYLQIERFARWGKILQEYPILIDFLAVSRDDASKAIGALDSLNNRSKKD